MIGYSFNGENWDSLLPRAINRHKSTAFDSFFIWISTRADRGFAGIVEFAGLENDGVELE